MHTNIPYENYELYIQQEYRLLGDIIHYNDMVSTCYSRVPKIKGTIEKH